MKRDQESFIRTTRLLNWVILLVIVGGFYCWNNTRGLPSPSALRGVLANEPLQTPTSTPDFRFGYEGTNYIIHPVAEYKLSGLVVSHNNITGLDDIYHTRKSVDVKDLCVIWGKNIEDDNYKSIEYSSNVWVCNVHAATQELWQKFHMDSLSNNHLLAGTSAIKDDIGKTKVGDQVEFSGWLVNYYPEGQPDRVRKTSTIRTDNGDGACEVVFVKEYRILEKWQSSWRLLTWWSEVLIGTLLLLKLGLFLVISYKA